MHKHFALVFALLFCCLSQINIADAQILGVIGGFGFGDLYHLSPNWNWKMLESEHFRVYFPEELKDIAVKATNNLEEADALLSPALQWKTKVKTPIFVIDNSDSANGSTLATARTGIVLYVTPPENWFSTQYYDDWLRLLCLHEYTHFLNMDATTGFFDVIRNVIGGNVLLPNSTWPTWMLEGLAVYMETRFTKAGRGRSPYYEMISRAAVEEGVLNKSSFITLDKINGTNPYNPVGETWYLFGYELMNEIAKEHPRQYSSGEDELGEMSIRGGGRIPYFINGNLENISGKTWYQFWDQWISETNGRQKTALAKIKSQPLTQFEPLTPAGLSPLGSAASSDRQWLAYTQATPDRRSGLYLRNLQTDETRRVDDKESGASLAFAPNARDLFFSAERQIDDYHTYSDLAVYDLEKDSIHWLTDGLRAKDPDISPDAQFLVFTLTEPATTSIAITALNKENGNYQIGPIKKLYSSLKYDRVSTPKFAPDGRYIVFSVHHNEKIGEDLVRLDIENSSYTTLVSDGHFNRFPAISSNGDVYFVSDATGVDNIYRLRPGKAPALLTNVTTGLAFPTFGPVPAGTPIGPMYATAYSNAGWSVVRLKLNDVAVNPNLVSVATPPSPPIDEKSVSHAAKENFPEKDYSIFPSIFPRVWSPTLEIGPANEVDVGAAVIGWDAVDRHRYLLYGNYDSLTGQANWFGFYSNRSFGPTFNFSAYQSTPFVGAAPFNYDRQLEYTFTTYYPFEWTYSRLVPQFDIDAVQRTNIRPGADPANGDVVGKYNFVPNLDAVLLYSSAETSNLAVIPEGGRSTRLGARVYLDQGSQVWKGLFTDKEYLRVTSHSVLIPSVKAAVVSHFDTNNRFINSLLEGRVYGGPSPFFPNAPFLGSFASDNFDQLSIRGYPNEIFLTTAAAVASLDYYFPLARIFRGWGTNPVFLDNFYGFVFGESAFFSSPLTADSQIALPSAGAGLELSTEFLIHVPLVFSLEFHDGFRSTFGGAPELFFRLGLGTISF